MTQKNTNQDKEHKFSKKAFEQYEKIVKLEGKPGDVDHYTYGKVFQAQYHAWTDSAKSPMSEKVLSKVQTEADTRAFVQTKESMLIREQLNSLNPTNRQGESSLEIDTREIQALNADIKEMQQTWNTIERKEPLWRGLTNIHEEGGALDMLRDEMNVKRERKRSLKAKWDEKPLASSVYEGRGNMYTLSKRKKVDQLESQLALMQDEVSGELSLSSEAQGEIKKGQEVPWWDVGEAKTILDSLNAVEQKR